MADFNPDTYIAEKTAPASGGFDPDAYIAEKTAPAPDDTPAIIKAGKNIWSGIKKSSADADAQKTMPEYLLHMVGGAAGNLMNIPVEAAKAAYSYVPQAVKTPIESEVKGVGEAVKSNKTLSDFLLGAQQWAKDNPRAAGNIGAAVNVASVLPVGKAVEAAGKGIADVAGPAVEKAAAAIVDKIPTATDKLDKAIQTGVTKGIKPTVIGKPSYDKLTNFYDKANQAVKVIAENREKLNLVDENGEALHHPRSAAEMAQAVDQAKKVIYDKYHAMATAAGDAGSEFDTEPILKELDKIAADPEEALPMGDPRLKYNPQTRAYANDLKSEIMELHGASPEIIEARIADLNNSLKGFYDGRVTKAKAQIDGSVAKLMRQQLDNNITSAVGEGYQDLKNQYGALKTVENEVAKRALVNARKANKGVADLTDIFTGGDLVAGTLSGNPALIAKGLFGRGIKEVYKSLNNPDRYIEKMFKKAYDVVPSGKDVELVKNAVAGVKPLPGPDADNPFYDLPKTKKEADAIMKSSASPGDVPAEHYTMGNFEDLETPEDFQMRKAVEAGYKPDVPGAQAPIDNSKFKMQLKNDFFPGTKAGKDINFADLSPAKQVQINKRVAGINTDPDRLQNFVEQGLIKQGEEIHPDDIVQWANEAGKVELKPKKLFGGLFDNMRPGSIGSNFKEAQQKSPEFKNWFGDWEKEPEKASKVVDDKGKPLVVYHGTGNDFTTFDNALNKRNTTKIPGEKETNKAFWFAENKSTTEFFANGGVRAPQGVLYPGAKVMENYINAKNPLIVDMKDYARTPGVAETKTMAIRSGKEGRVAGDNGEFKTKKEIYDIGSIKERMVKKAKAEGKDGIIFKNGYDFRPFDGDVFAVFEPNQIKSATGNSGKFDPKNHNITWSIGSALGAGGVTLEKVLHKKDEHGQSFADILKGIVDNMQGGK